MDFNYFPTKEAAKTLSLPSYMSNDLQRSQARGRNLV